jgi:SulP family sulfate permease
MAGVDHVVVAIGSADADASLMAYAAMLARLGDTKEVRFVHVAEGDVDAPALRAEMRARVATAFQGVSASTDCDVLHGSITDRLLGYVAEFQADLVLIGAKRHKLGARLAMVAPCSVGVVPSPCPATLSHLLVAFDCSASATETLQWATSLIAADRSIRCTALHVITHESTDLFGDSDSDAGQTDAIRRIVRDANRHGVAIDVRIANLSRATDDDDRPFVSPASMHANDVAHTILDEARACGADCLALSTRGRSKSAAILLGSVTEKAIERSELPLLVGKHGGKNLDLVSILLGRAGWQSSIKTN